MKVTAVLVAGMVTAAVAGCSYYFARVGNDGALGLQLAWHSAWCAGLTLVFAVLWRDAFRSLGDRLTLILILLLTILPLAGLWRIGLLRL
jgi:hypothetical protein